MGVIVKIAKWIIVLSLLGIIFIAWIVITGDDATEVDVDKVPDDSTVIIDDVTEQIEDLNDASVELQHVNIIDGVNGYTVNVEVHNEPVSFITNSSAILSDFADILYILRDSGLNIETINFVSQMNLIDQYGNGEYGDMFTMTISRDTIAKLGDDRDIFNADNLITISESWWMHDILWDE